MHDGWFINTEIDEMDRSQGWRWSMVWNHWRKMGSFNYHHRQMQADILCPLEPKRYGRPKPWRLEFAKQGTFARLCVNDFQDGLFGGSCCQDTCENIWDHSQEGEWHQEYPRVIETGAGCKVVQRFHFLINFVHGILSQKGPLHLFHQFVFVGGQWNHVFLGHGMCHHHCHWCVPISSWWALAALVHPLGRKQRVGCNFFLKGICSGTSFPEFSRFPVKFFLNHASDEWCDVVRGALQPAATYRFRYPPRC